jgi:AraC family transcriptional regulator
MHKEETHNYYRRKLDDILEYVRNNLNGDLNIKTLAERSNISFFHFHRIVTAYLGESLGSYINRLRLDTAAKLIKNSNENMSEIAIKIGYSDVQAFSKSFTRAYGISPSDYRADQESVIDSTIDFTFRENKIENHSINPKVKSIPSRRIIYIEVTGKYGGNEVDEAWKLIIDFSIRNKIFSWNTEAFSIYYDDPEIIDADLCRSDICITTHKTIEATGTIRSRELEGGKYLIFRYKGPYDNLWEVYDILYRDVIIGLNKYQIRDMPVMEKYIKYSEKIKPENLVTEIQIPIK